MIKNIIHSDELRKKYHAQDQRKLPWLKIISMCTLIIFYGQHAQALEPLEVYLRAARSYSIDGREADLLDQEAFAQIATARAALLPSVSASGTYTRNQYQTASTISDGMGGTRQIVFSPYNQLSANIIVSVPIINLSSIYSLRAARLGQTASDSSRILALLEVDRQVVRAYYDVAATHELSRSAQNAREVAEASFREVSARVEAGLSSELDRIRAEAEKQRLQGNYAEAMRLEAEAKRRLERLSGVAVQSDHEWSAPELQNQTRVEEHLSEIDNLPAVHAATNQMNAAQASLNAARSQFAPRISATGTEYFTNGRGFGYSPVWTVALTATVQLGASSAAAIRTAAAAAERASLEEERARIDAREAIISSYETMTTLIERVSASRAQERAAQDAARVAHERYRVGLLSQLDVLTADRDVFSAQASRIQVEADLYYARVNLRMVAGQWEAP